MTETHMNLQLFADGEKMPPNVEKDDPNRPDDDVDPGGEGDELNPGDIGDEQDDDDTGGAETDGEVDGGGEEDGEKDAAGKPPDATDAGAKSATPAADDRVEPKFTQADVDRIVGERLSRDRKSQAVRDLEARHGKPIEQILADQDAEQARADRQKRAEQYMADFGWDEDRAKAQAERDEAQEKRLRALEAGHQERQRRDEEHARVSAYNEAKSKADHPLVKRYAAEIDEFAKGGRAIDWEPAMAFVIGQKILSGEALKDKDLARNLLPKEVLQDMETAAEQRTLANVNRRAKAAPEKAAAPGGTGLPNLSPLQAEVAKRLGVDPKRYAANLARRQKSS